MHARERSHSDVLGLGKHEMPSLWPAHLKLGPVVRSGASLGDLATTYASETESVHDTES